MEAAVPFALLAGVQMVAFAASLGLAATGALAAYRRDARVLVALGGLLLAASHALTGAELGAGGSDRLTLLRAGGYLLVAVGASGFHVVDLPVVVPLGASGPASLVATGTAALAALAGLRVRRAGGRLFAVAFALAAVAESLGHLAQTSSGAAIGVLVLRGVSAAAMVGFVARVADTRLLSKVVAAILAGVLALSVGIALVVGSVATSALDRDTAATIERIAEGQLEALRDAADVSQTYARSIAPTCVQKPDCGQLVSSLTADPHPITAQVRSDGRVPKPIVGLTDVEALALAQSPVVKESLRRGTPASTPEVLLGSPPKLVALGIAPPPGAPAGKPVSVVYVYGSVIGKERVDRIKAETDFDATVFVGDEAVVSSLAAGAVLDRLTSELTGRGVADSLAGGGRDGVTVPAEGARPAVRYAAVRNARGEFVAVLALSADSNVILRTQRSVLRALFGGTLAVALLVGLLAVVLGRRIVRPVQQLTLAASRVRRGDLSVRTEVKSVDELGVLSRTFDAMTRSLEETTEDLVRAAEDEAALRGRLQAVLNSMADGLVTTDAAEVVTGVNPAAASMLGRGEEELVGRPVTEVLAGTDMSGAPLVGALAGKPGVRAGVVVGAGGRGVPVVLVLTPLQSGEGHVVVLRDTTREREIERMKTEFLSNVSHELRTPLTPIRGYAEILHRRTGLPPEKISEYAGSILDSSVRMSRVVDLLVDVAALEAGRVEPAIGSVGAAAFVDERLDAWRRREPGRAFRRRVASGLPPVLMDEVWVAKAFDELVDNAVKYSTGAVTIAATASEDGRRVRLTVRDTGAGISEEHRSVLFTPFAQLDGSATRSVGGLGLGLSFVRRVADDFGLDVVVESTLGKGSAFSLEVPVADGPRWATRRHVGRRRVRAAQGGVR